MRVPSFLNRIVPSIPARLFLLLALVAAPQAAPAQHGEQAVTVTDLLNIRVLDNVARSPDGRQVMYTIQSIHAVENSTATNASGTESAEGRVADYEYRSHLYIVDATGRSAPRQLTRGESSADDPVWHPDGDRLAFVRTVDGKPQIFVLPLLGGESYQITDQENGATSPRWSPDGSRLLFSSKLTTAQLRDRLERGPDWPIERPARAFDDTTGARANPDGSLREIRTWLARNEAEGNPRVFHRLNIQGETDLEDHPTFRHWFIVEPDSEQAVPVMITSGFYDFASAEWLSDGARVVISGKMTGDAHPDRVLDSDLYVAFTDGSGIEPLVDMDGYAVSHPAVSPDGRSIAFLARNTDDPGYAQSEVGLYALDEGEARLLTLDFDRSASAPQWSPDGWYLYFTAAANGGFPLYRMPAFGAATDSDSTFAEDAGEPTPADTLMSELELGPPDVAPIDTTEEPSDGISGMLVDSLLVDTALSSPGAGGSLVERLTSFERGIRSFDVGSATIFYVASEVANPYELYASNSPFTSDRPLTSHNAQWITGKRLSFPEPFTLQRDGLEIQYWIMKPAFFDPNQTYPLLHQIHGGPAAMWGPGEASMWHEFQFFASRGYGIVFSNPRGSGGYGYDFQRANYQDWGEGPAEDVLHVATEAAKQPWVDSDRQVVTGGSYAGYLTAFIVGHDDRFKAAVAQRGVYDLGTFLGEGNAWRLIPSHFGGFPWNRDVDSTMSAEQFVQVLPLPGEPSDTSVIQAEPAPDSQEQAGETPGDEYSTTERQLAVSEILHSNSPLSYVDRIRTPLLIMHADRDLRTGVAQSETLYKSLKILERDVEYVRYPDSGHELSRSGAPLQRMDRILRIYEFLERFID